MSEAATTDTGTTTLPGDTKAAESVTTTLTTDVPATPAATIPATTTADDATKAPEAEIVYPELTMPVGMDVDTGLLTQFTDYAKSNKLDPATYQGVADLYIQAKQAEVAAYAETIAGWVKVVESDPNLGGLNFEPSKAVARSAVARFGDAELVQFLTETGIGNHPAWFRFAHKVGLATSEDASVVKGDPNNRGNIMTDESRADRFYPTTAALKGN